MEKKKCDICNEWQENTVLVEMCQSCYDKSLDDGWEAYPQNKPSESGLYLVTSYSPSRGKKWLQRDYYNAKFDEWDGVYVLAWMPLPEIYEGEREVNDE